MVHFYFFSSILFLALYVALPVCASAQILYTDIEPDTTIQAASGSMFADFNLDLNNDGKSDFKFEHFAPDPLNMAVEVYSWPDAVEEAIMVDVFSGHPSAAQKGNAITLALSSKQFINTYTGSSNTALFINKAEQLNEAWDTGEDRYLGVAIKINGGWHHGWVRMNMPADASAFTIKDYAIELTENETIFAGDMGTTPVDLPGDPLLDIHIYSQGDNVVVELPGNGTEGILNLYSILGAHVGQYALSGQRSIINVAQAIPGAYAAVVRHGSRIQTKMVAVW